MDTYIYVISDGKSLDEFKIGKHKGDKKSLNKRYVTSLPTYQVHYFGYSSDYSNDERKILNRLNSYRITNRNSKKSEWIKCSLVTILDVVSEIVGEQSDINSVKKNSKTKVKQYKLSDIKVNNVSEEKIRDSMYTEEIIIRSLKQLNKVYDSEHSIDYHCGDLNQFAYLNHDKQYKCPISGLIHDQIDNHYSGQLEYNNGFVAYKCYHGCKNEDGSKYKIVNMICGIDINDCVRSTIKRIYKYMKKDENLKLAQDSIDSINKRFGCEHRIYWTKNEDNTLFELECNQPSYACPFTSKPHCNSEEDIEYNECVSGTIEIDESERVLFACKHGCTITLDGKKRDKLDITPLRKPFHEENARMIAMSLLNENE